MLRERPTAVGVAWAKALCLNMKTQGRIIAGGWPGTIGEARARIARHLQDELAAAGMPALCREELDAAASATNLGAKAAWLEAERSSRLRRQKGSLAAK